MKSITELTRSAYLTKIRAGFLLWTEWVIDSMFHSVWLAGCEHHLYSTAKIIMHFENKNSGSLKKKKCAISENRDLKRIFGITRLLLCLPKALAQAASPVNAAHAPDLSNLFWSVAFLGARFICETICCAQSRGCEDPSRCCSWYWLGHGVTSVADTWDPAQLGRTGAAGRLWLPAVTVLQLWSRGWAGAAGFELACVCFCWHPAVVECLLLGHWWLCLLFQENVRALMKGVRAAMGYRPGSGLVPATAPNPGSVVGKPWKKHGNRNKKEKLRRITKHLEA